MNKHKKIMYSCHLIVVLLVFLFQSVCGNQNAAFDKNYSDRLTETNNQRQSSLEHSNNAATIASGSHRFIASATDSLVDSRAPHETSHVNAPATKIIMNFYFVCLLHKY